VIRFQAGRRVLFSIDKPTADLDNNIELYWDPRVIAQSKAMKDLDVKTGLIFYDYSAKRIFAGGEMIQLPPWLQGETSEIFTGEFAGDSKPDFLFARIRDTDFHLGKKIEDVVEYTGWGWTYRNSRNGAWDAEYSRWLADWDIPLVTDVNNDGFDDHIAYRIRTKQWLLAPNGNLSGPVAEPDSLPMPLAGRFLKGSTKDLGLWIMRSGLVELQSLNTGQSVTFRWGGSPGDILVPADYEATEWMRLPCGSERIRRGTGGTHLMVRLHKRRSAARREFRFPRITTTMVKSISLTGSRAITRFTSAMIRVRQSRSRFRSLRIRFLHS